MLVQKEMDAPDEDHEEEELALVPQKMGDEPAWVVDTNTYNLWQLGVVPMGLLSADAAAQILRVREWAAAEAALRAGAQPQASLMLVEPCVQATLTLMNEPEPPREPPHEPPAAQLFEASDATLALARKLAEGPRVGKSPTTVMDA